MERKLNFTGTGGFAHIAEHKTRKLEEQHVLTVYRGHPSIYRGRLDASGVNEVEDIVKREV